MSQVDSNIDVTNLPKRRHMPFMNQEEFDQYYVVCPSPKIRHRKRKIVSKFCYPFLSVANFIRFFTSFMPIIKWIRRYRWKSWFAGDLLAGITVGIMHVPQGIAYAILTGVDPVYGLYSSFFPIFFYMIFGTSKHVSVGSIAIISLMSGTSLEHIHSAIFEEHLHDEGQYIDKAAKEGITSLDIRNLTLAVPFRLSTVSAIEIITALTFCTGIIQLAMAVLRVEFVASYLSDQVVSGFSTGASVHVIIAQLDKAIQVTVSRTSGPGNMLVHFVEVIQKAGEMNKVTALISLCAMIFLYLGKDIINVRLQKRIPVAIPFELLLVIIVTAVSYIFNFQENYGVTIVNSVPVGLPVAHIPRLDLMPWVIKDAVEIAFVIVAVHLSMCKVFNRRHKYKTDNNQELYALGLMATLSSCFYTYPVCSALGRSMVNDESGAHTQLAALFSCLLVLVVILWLGPLLQALPMCILAVIIIFSMKNVFKKSKELRELWKVSKIDFIIWLGCFLCTLFTDVMWGLGLSVIFALLTTVFRTQWPQWHMLAKLKGTKYYRDCGRYKNVVEHENIRVLRFDAPLLFTNVDHFRNAVERSVVKYPLARLPTAGSFNESDHVDVHTKTFGKKIASIGSFLSNYTSTPPVRRVEHLVIDCSGFTFIDFMSVNSLKEIFHHMKSEGVKLYFAGAKSGFSSFPSPF
ncbi:hypothetical protein AB6A40_006875 [Gnathostoma spinigerum]|uniref:STAS domain-containing protein n=1 Tax=Gnathostoma spinigerum TaxID=75299 RepID=A0ABD6EK78_9BILA